MINVKNQMLWKPPLVIVSGIATVILMLILALFVIGPAVRHFWGEPYGFNEDYMSPNTFRQVLIVQGIALGIGHILYGLTASSWFQARRILWSYLATNPLTVFVGFLLYFLIIPQDNVPSEYFSFLVGGILALLSLVIWAPCVFLGISIAKRLKN